MNHFTSRGLSCLDLRAMEAKIECVQSRRLPYLQIIGASSAAAAEQRERLMAAMESSGFRLPRRRITLRYSPDLHGLPLESFDCAAALAILGSAGAFPSFDRAKFVAVGALNLAGELSAPGFHPAALREWRALHPQTKILLPPGQSFSEAERDSIVEFSNLAALVQFLRDGKSPRVASNAPWPACKPSVSAFHLAPADLRLAEISAAGHHHLLLVGDRSGRGAELAQCLRYLRTPAEGKEASLREVREEQMSRLFRFDAKTGQWGDLSLAHEGVLHLRNFHGTEGAGRGSALRALEESMTTGGLRGYRSGHPVSAPAGGLVLAESAVCECGCQGKRGCRCRPGLKERKWESLSRAPFDLKSFSNEELATESMDAKGALLQVNRVRDCSLAERGKPNGWLSLPEILKAKVWEPEPLAWLKVGDRSATKNESLARVALTLSDLREGASVQRGDVLEAWHYVAGLEFGGEPAAKKRWSASALEPKSTAIP